MKATLLKPLLAVGAAAALVGGVHALSWALGGSAHLSGDPNALPQTATDGTTGTSGTTSTTGTSAAGPTPCDGTPTSCGGDVPNCQDCTASAPPNSVGTCPDG